MGCAASQPEADAVVKPPAQSGQNNNVPKAAAKEGIEQAPVQNGNGASHAQSPLYAAPPAKSPSAGQQQAAAAPAAAQSAQPAGSQAAVNQSLKSLSANEANAVQATLLKVSTLIQKFAEGRSERTTPVQAVRRALNLVTADCRAKYASVSVLSETQEHALLVTAVGVPDTVHEGNRLLKVPGSNSSAERILQKGTDFFYWQPSANEGPAPSDWSALASAAGLTYIAAVPIKVSDKVIGVLTVGFGDAAADEADYIMFPTYLQLVAASLSSMVKDNSIPKYMTLVKDLHETQDLDNLMHKVVQHLRTVLGHSSNHHIWYRIGLTAPNNTASTIFDDLTQVPPTLMQRTLSNPTGSSSFKLLKEVQAAGGVMRTVVAMKNTVMKIAVHNRQQVMIPDVQKVINQSGNVSADIFNTRLIKPPTSVLVFPLKVKQHIFGVIFCMSSVQSDFSDVSPKLREVCEVMSPHLLFMLTQPLANDYKTMQTASLTQTAGGSMMSEGGSMSGILTGAGGSIGRSDSLGVSLSGDSFMYTQSRSSTGALVTGLTEKLNQKRIRSSMDFHNNTTMTDLQISGLLGEGGFAKVFRGLWRGLVVGVKVVCDDGKNEKMVMKNAHEIAILSALSHPNIVQAYNCLTDVLVRDLLNVTIHRYNNPTVLNSPAYKYLLSMEDKTCHLEVIEYCDLGNLSNALKNNIFLIPNPVIAAAAGAGDGAAAAELAERARQQPMKVNMRTLLLTLIEIASACGYLHRMGVVHCDIKPANVLLKSSNIDFRGFTAKVSDFGLSRVEDDDTCASFPFNSCGTAAYVAPEALICNKKVNSSVDVYAFGILMWEMYTGQRPYGNMKQQQLVEEVVMRGLRPKFPGTAPAGYVVLAQSAWSGSPQARPSFDEILTHLNAMLQQVDDREMDSMVGGSFGSMGEKFEYMQQQMQQQQQQGGAGVVIPGNMDRRPSQVNRRGPGAPGSVPQIPSPMGPGASPRTTGGGMQGGGGSNPGTAAAPAGAALVNGQGGGSQVGQGPLVGGPSQAAGGAQSPMLIPAGSRPPQQQQQLPASQPQPVAATQQQPQPGAGGAVGSGQMYSSA
ncbi:hypothetical protein Vretimale_11467 [Volvox reticuliferus]|uniref:Protein kinase domain-containing protein n=1 Tax=Volvox reticuliferus TaxID=1737510 RepID=A0A8J4CJJ7_9CHLO|nr:hypothetical protein Vretifemale_11946 [Volvox reticuliferus]GIM07270.1 hypothetical protein Vretimale_11467 [Volvox reticuliferus]